MARSNMSRQPAHFARPTLRVCVCLAALILLLIGGAACSRQNGTAGRGRSQQAVPVTVASVAQRDVPVDIEVIGNVEAYSTVAAKAQVGGQLVKVNFNEGDFVRKGDVLFEIDKRQYQAAAEQAEANHLRDQALLAQAQANLARDTAQQQYIQSQASRAAQLFQSGIFSKDQNEMVRANADAISQTLKADHAAIESARAQQAAGSAALANAKLQLEYTTIHSPIDGRTGNIAVKQGNIVVPNTMDLTTINQVQPIYVTFSVPEARLADIKKYMAQRKLQVFAITQDQEAAREAGTLSFVDNTVDLTTGTIKLKGTFPNAGRKLWPGQFVRVVLRLTTQPNGLVIPNQAVQTGQDGQFVYVVKADKTVEMRPVTPGLRVDQNVVIDRGLQAGETVVTEGQVRLGPGSRVQLRDGSGKSAEGGEQGDQAPGENGSQPRGNRPRGAKQGA